MNPKTHSKLMIVAAIIVLAVVASAIASTNDTERETPKIEIEGEWNLVSNQSYDGVKRYTEIRENQNMVIDGKYRSGDNVIFYGHIGTDKTFAGGYYFTGLYAMNKVMFNYETEEGYVRANGFVNTDGNLEMTEVHYYMNIKAPFWYVSKCIYSKDPTLLEVEAIPDAPEVNQYWKFWAGTSSTYDQDFVLSGSSFQIYGQIGIFFKGEMQQNVGDKVIVKSLIGVFTGKTDEYWIAQLMDETGLTWIAYIGLDTMMLRCVTTSEVSEIYGLPVAIERVYYNINRSIGPPKLFTVENELLLQTWKTTGYYEVSGDGGIKYISIGDYEMKVDKELDCVVFGKNDTSEFLKTTLSMFIVYDGSLPLNMMIYMIAELGEGEIHYGYMCMTDDGNTMYQAIFWYDAETDMNGVTVIEFNKA